MENLGTRNFRVVPCDQTTKLILRNRITHEYRLVQRTQEITQDSQKGERRRYEMEVQEIKEIN
jgi:hypothetical protein